MFRLIGGAAKLAVQDRHLMGWAFRRSPMLGYVGWVNRGNMGDEAMIDTHRQFAKAPWRLRSLPLHRPGRLAVEKLGGDWDILLMGGGTVVGLDAWADRVESLVEMRPNARKVVLGAGVEDIQFGMDRGLTTSSGLKRWSKILSGFDYVGVRGPDSEETLRTLDVESEVVGDTVLNLHFRRESKWLPPAGKRVAVNFTSVGTALSGTDQLRQKVARSCRTLTESGFRISAFGMDRGDLRTTEKVLRDAGLDVESLVDTFDGVVGCIQGASLVISERLHGAVFASSMGIPFIHIGYKPKSYDFMRSIDAASWLLDTNASEENICELIEERLKGGVSRNELDAVTGLRQKFAGAWESEVHFQSRLKDW